MRPTLLYDADCGFCTKAAGFVQRLHLDLDVLALQTVQLEPLGVSPDRALKEIPFVAADGAVVYGHEAIGAALRTGAAPLRLVGRLLAAPGVSVVARPVYRWVAQHRHQLPGGTPSCALPSDGSDGRA